VLPVGTEDIDIFTGYEKEQPFSSIEKDGAASKGF
jgi:hypothetical protein